MMKFTVWNTDSTADSRVGCCTQWEIAMGKEGFARPACSVRDVTAHRDLRALEADGDPTRPPDHDAFGFYPSGSVMKT